MAFTDADIDRVERFWKAPNMARKPGLIITDIVKAIDAGAIKALWVIGTNPAVSLPQTGDVKAAFRKLELFVVSENVSSNDTLNSGSHVRLPGQAWGEKDGTVTNSERRISRQRRFLMPVGEAMPDWWAVSQVGRRLGFSGFDFETPRDVFAEHAALSGFENAGTRDFDIGSLGAINPTLYEKLAPVQWPQPSGGGGVPRFFAAGGFFTPSRKAQFVAPAPPQLAEQVSASFPLLLNTGRIRDQWHTMTRTGLSPRLGMHLPEPFVSVHPNDAERFGLKDGGLARLTNHHGSGTFRVVFSNRQERGAVFVPMHWNDEMASDARAGSMVHAIVDPISGQPDSKATPVAIAPVTMRSAGFLLSRSRMHLPRTSYWAWTAISGGFAARVDTDGDGLDLFGVVAGAAGEADTLRYLDVRRGISRTALIAEDRLVGGLFLAPSADPPKWSILEEAWNAESIDKAMRRVVLSGKRLDGAADEGANVCACFGVPEGRILAAIRDGATSVDAIGAKLKAGTNCGSCKPELKRLIVEASGKEGARVKQGAS